MYKKLIHFRFFLQISSALLISCAFSFVSCKYFHENGHRPSRAQPYASVSGLHHTFTFFVFNLPLTKSTDQRKTASHAERR